MIFGSLTTYQCRNCECIFLVLFEGVGERYVEKAVAHLS